MCRFGRNFHPIGQLTHTRRSDGGPEPDGDLRKWVEQRYMGPSKKVMLFIMNR